MFGFIKDRHQEINLLEFAKLEAQCNKHNIQEALKLEAHTKADGSIHKTKEKQKQTIINGWKKEQGKLKTFFHAHRKEKEYGDYRNYKFRRGITNTREHLNGTTNS